MIAALVLAAAVGAPAATAAEVGAPVPAAIAAAQVLDSDGVSRPLAEAWRERPAILIFLRHYG